MVSVVVSFAAVLDSSPPSAQGGAQRWGLVDAVHGSRSDDLLSGCITAALVQLVEDSEVVPIDAL